MKNFVVAILALGLLTHPAKAQINGLDLLGINYSTPVEYQIADIQVVGAKFLDPGSLVSMFGFRKGDMVTVPGDELAMGIKRLWRTGLVGDITLSATKVDGGKIWLLLELKERPRLANYFISGLKRGQVETLEDKLSLIRGRIVTDALRKNAENTIYKHYAEKGFLNCDVKSYLQPDTSGILSGSAVNLILDVDKGPKVRVKEITINGLEGEFTEKKIKKKLKKTKERKFGRIFKSAKFIREEYKADKKNLISFYRKNGYRNASILSDSVYDIDDKHVGIIMNLEEGNKFYYRDIRWNGNNIYSDDTLAKTLGIEKGDVYNPEELEKRLNFNPNGLDVTSLYMDDGYLFFSVQPVEAKIEGDSIDMEMRIYEGERAKVNSIRINGNTKTNDHVILREIRTLPGEYFSRADLIRTQSELARLGYFNPQTIGINPMPNIADGTVDIEYTLEEQPNDQIELSGGWGGVFGFVGTLGLVFNNFSARNLFNLDAYRPLPAGDGQRLSLRMQANGVRFQSYSASFTEPWLGGRKPNSFTVSLNHSVQRRVTPTGRSLGSLKVTGATVSLGKRLQVPDDFFTLVNSFSYLVYNLDNFNTFGFNNFSDGRSNNITFTTTLSRNSLNSFNYPTKGANISLAVSVTPPYSAFQTANFANISDQERFEWVEYHKWMFDNSWFLPLTKKLVINARAHMGIISPFNNQKGLGPFERFILGGDGLAQNGFLLGTDIVGLRGYNNNSIVPPGGSGAGGVAYNKFVLELRYPLSLKPAATVYVHGFIEAGNNWAQVNEFNPFNLYRSAGVGARIFMPAFGLLGVDWGYGFDAIPGNPGANEGQFHFTIGQQIR